MQTKLLTFIFLTGALILPFGLMASVEEQPQVPTSYPADFDYMEPNESEIQRMHEGGKSCGPTEHDGEDCGQDAILAHSYPVPVYGNVCRNGLFYCYTYAPAPVGALCHCHDFFGNIWLEGTVHTW